MYNVKVDIKDVMTDAPNAANNLLEQLPDLEGFKFDDIVWCYIFDVDDIGNNVESKILMNQAERTEYEMCNTICYLYMTINNVSYSEKLLDIPKKVEDIVKEYTKILI